MRGLESFTCLVEDEQDAVLIQPFGELDCWTVPALEQHLLDARDTGAGRVTLDLRRLSFLDSSAVALVLRWSRESAEHGFQLRVLGGTERTRRVFEITATAHLLVDGPRAA